MSALDNVYCIGNNEYKSMRTLINSYRELESVKNTEIDGRTIHFWALQLQFMALDTNSLVNAFDELDIIFPNTKYVKRARRKVRKYRSLFNNQLDVNEHNCIATTLALQLSGLV